MRKIFFVAIILTALFAGQIASEENLLSDRQCFRGNASWYGPGFFHKETASGKVYGVKDVFVAHRSYPFGTLLEIVNLRNGKRIVAPVEDRGPYVFPREIDLSFAAAKALSAFEEGVIPVLFKPIIRQ